MSVTPRGRPSPVRLEVSPRLRSSPLRNASPLRPHSTQPWKKLLYLKQPYPDNYIDESFLLQLKRNTTVKKYSYWKLVSDFSLIVLHISSLAIVVLFFTGIYTEKWDPTWGTVVSCTFTALAFTFEQYITKYATLAVKPLQIDSGPYESTNQSPSIKSFFVMILIILVISPVLKSLTKSTSSDSIWALSFILCIASTMLHDYAMDTSVDQYRPILSTNISLSNAIVLASRLSSTVQVFCFILFAIQFNVFVPLFDFSIRKYLISRTLHNVLVSSLVLILYYSIVVLFDYKILLYWILIHVGIAFVLPVYFLFLQKYKNELQGPWDIAKPVINSKKPI